MRITKPIQYNDYEYEDEDDDGDGDANKKVDSEVNLPPAVHPDEHFLAKPIM